MTALPQQAESLGPYQPYFEAALQRAEAEGFVRCIWAKDAALWKSTAEHQKIINNSLGWLTVAEWTAQRVDQMQTFAREVREAGFTHLMLLGMGGSSLCPEVFRRTFHRRDGFPELLVLDTTDPYTIADYESRVDLAKTLFIVSSKSGSTIEPLSFYKYFFERVRSVKHDQAGENFLAITDPGTLMERIAREAAFRQIFLNPPDIGGRYSALSYFGMLPATLMGLDTAGLLHNAIGAMEASGTSIPSEANAALRLGCALGALANAGSDKLTLVTSPDVSSLGLWIEQLVAESTGKEGKGIVPVVGEPLGPPEAYGTDRVFVVLSADRLDEETESRLRSLEGKGHPVLRRNLSDASNLCAEFFIWEFATAVAGRLLEINPFDQPNVQESKDNTNSLLAEFKKNGSLPDQALLASADGLKVYGAAGGATPGSTTADKPPLDVIKDHLSRVKPDDYVALLAYIQETNAHDDQLQAIRMRLRDRFQVATTTGYGPRFLHSTGQLHKGGPDSGVFIQITCEANTDLAIPGEPYTFGILRQAQALGDFSSLASRDRRAIRVHLGRDVDAGLKKLLASL
ncbi:MAG: bifunctional transaldolase/phosoglucose isomerase [Pyrinomonadaceae bacterium]